MLTPQERVGRRLLPAARQREQALDGAPRKEVADARGGVGHVLEELEGAVVNLGGRVGGGGVVVWMVG